MIGPSQLERAATFARLHVKGTPLVLFNIWDAGTAQAVARAGAKALATGSWSVAGAHGYADGEKIPLELALANMREIVGAIDLPLTVDLESGYGTEPEVVAETVTKALRTGVIGFNLEDRVQGSDSLYAIPDACARLAAARAAADRMQIPAFINARTDMFLNAEPAKHTSAMVDQALERAEAFADAGADGFFAPGLIDESLVRALCDACPLPVNILVRPTTPSARRLPELGVARLSYGPGPYRLAMETIEGAARLAFS